MNTLEKPDDPNDPFDQELSRRLAQLGAAPVDTSAFHRAFKQQLPPPAAPRRRWVAALSAVAASILVILTVSLALGLFQSRAVEASAQTMAQMHEDILAGRTTMMVSNIDQANAAIAAMSGDFPKLPSAPDSHTMACCMKSIGNKKVACVLLEDAGVPVTMSVAQASDVVSPPAARTVIHDGITYHVQDIGNLHMVMTEHANKWICLISSAPADRLMDIAGKLKAD